MQTKLTLKLIDPIAHLIEAKLTLVNDKAQSLTLALPRWIPGSYLVRDFAKHIAKLSAVDGQGNEIELVRLDLSRWQLNAPVGEVHVDYELYAYDASVRANYFCPSYAFINPAASAIYVEQWRNEPYTLAVELPTLAQDWQVYTTMCPHASSIPLHYQAKNYDDLIEHPLLIGNGVVIDWQVADMPHRMVLVDEAPLSDIDTAKIIEDLTAICSAQHQFWQNAPYPQYLFQVMVSHDGYGGLEHNNSTALMTSRASLPRRNQSLTKTYEDFLGLCSHEYFHAWLVKRIKPDVLLKPNLQDAVLTPMLWVFEGFTSLYDDWFLLRSGRINHKQLLVRWSDSISRTLVTQGGEHQSLSDASSEAWIKFYQQNENSTNSQISYYTRGAVVALILCAELVKHEKHLDDVLWLWWNQWQQADYKGLSHKFLIQDLQSLCPKVDWHAWLHEQVLMPNPNIVAHLTKGLTNLGLSLTATEKTSLGCKLAEEANALMVKQVTIDSPAHQAGLQVGDEIIAINGWRVRTSAQIEQVLERWISKQTEMAFNITLNHKGFLQQTVLLPTRETINYQLSLSEAEPLWLKNENHHDPK
jgi:predicted metalloprotease with PDZ domain